MKITINSYAADFETTTTAPARVWAWQVRSIRTGKVHSQGTTIESFLEEVPTGVVFFHNLKFDASYILDAILNLGLVRVELDKSKAGKAKGLDTLKPGQFTSLIGDLGQHYAFSWDLGRGTTQTYDSLKKAPNTLKELAVAYGAPVLKGDLDYAKPRPVGYEPTPEEWAYLDNDTAILAHVLHAIIGEGYTSITTAGDCFRIWLDMNHIASTNRGKKPMDTFRSEFPVLQGYMEDDIRHAYRGGWTFVNPRYQGRVIEGGGIVLDVNSMYPSVMVQEMFPVGQPLPILPGGPSRASHPFEIRGNVITYTLKSNRFPIIPENAVSFGSNGWSNEGEEITVWATMREWALIQENYDVVVEKELGGYAFRVKHGSEIFGEYIDKYMEIKKVSKGAKRILAKLTLNGLWGKFGMNPLRGQRIPTLVNGVVKMVATKKQRDDGVYSPLAIAVTAYARERMVRAAQANWARFAYADTDSLHLVGTEPAEGIEVDEKELGAWAHEGTWSEAFYCRAKGYIERMVEESEELLVDPATGLRNIQVAMAGLPKEAREGLTPETVYDGMTFGGKLGSKRVQGGIILEPIAWRLDFEHGIVLADPVEYDAPFIPGEFSVKITQGHPGTRPEDIRKAWEAGITLDVVAEYPHLNAREIVDPAYRDIPAEFVDAMFG